MTTYNKLPYSNQFERGHSFNWAGKWKEGKYYYNNEYVTDFVVYKNVVIVCRKDHLSTKELEPKLVISGDAVVDVRTPYWEFVVAGSGDSSYVIQNITYDDTTKTITIMYGNGMSESFPFNVTDNSIHIGPDEPTDNSKLWLDTTNSSNILLKSYNTDRWNVIASTTAYTNAVNAYQKPNTGIPESDLAESVSNKLNGNHDIFWATYGETTSSEIDAEITSGKVVMCNYNDKIYIYTSIVGDNSYFTAIIGTVNSGYLILNRLTDTWQNGLLSLEATTNRVNTLVGHETDETKYPSTKAVWNAISGVSGNQIFWATYGTTTYADILAAIAAEKLVVCVNGSLMFVHTYKTADRIDFCGIAVATRLYTISVTSANVWSQSFVGAENTANKVQTIEGNETSTTKYPSAKAVWDAMAAGKEIFWAEYGVTTYADVKTAHDAGKLCAALKGTDNKVYILEQINTFAARFYTTQAQYNYELRVNNDNTWQTGSTGFVRSSDIVQTIVGNETVTNKYPSTKAVADALATKYTLPSNGIPASDLADGVIPDVSSFITKSVNDLTNYYTKSQTYTKDEISSLIGSIQQFHYEIYASTETATNPQSNVLYLIGPTGSGSDKYEEYVYANNTWTKIGDTSINLSDYITLSVLNARLADYALSSAIPTSLSQLTADETHRLVTDTEKSTWNGKQDTLVSGTTIKTINNTSLLGDGDITINDAIGFDNVSSLQDGTVDIELTSGDSIKIDLNHNHTQYPKYVVCADESEYNNIQTKDNSTLYLIEGSGGSGGSISGYVTTQTFNTAITNLSNRISAIEQSITNGFTSLTVGDLTITSSVTNNGEDDHYEGEGIPNIISSRVGRRYLDITNNHWYTAVGTTTASQWVRDTNSIIGNEITQEND